ncbi:MAG: DUF3592 domain-containing protein [Cyanobacteria bacterium]|nr:DUF3592 domain-containing protein [Cyanobacteriota bacterium]
MGERPKLNAPKIFSSPSKFAVIVSVVALMIAVYLGFTGYRDFNGDIAEVRRMAGSTDWPTTQAIITESTVERGEEHRDFETRTIYSPRISYKYSVNGKSYSSDRVSFGTSMVSTSYEKDGASWVVSLYPKGSTHTVFYSPQKAEQSVLVPGIMPLEIYIPSLSKLAFVPAILVVVIVLLLLGDIDTVRKRLLFVLSCVVVAFTTMAIGMFSQKQLVKSVVPEHKLLSCEDEGYYIGQQKFKY